MNLFEKCEVCKRYKLWFQKVEHREMKPNSFMPLVKSEKKMCGKCFKRIKSYNFKVDGK